MSSQEIINITLAVGFLIITVCIIFVTYFLIKALKSITALSENIREKIQNRFLSAIPALFIALVGRFFKKRG
ncbi:MAG: hypothetical protein Q8Q91_02030 [Candidatus Daviesbacteria bacterium]|nr:hypothetical protein [Candidatus Daviesbacteria bacterium]